LRVLVYLFALMMLVNLNTVCLAGDVEDVFERPGLLAKTFTGASSASDNEEEAIVQPINSKGPITDDNEQKKYKNPSKSVLRKITIKTRNARNSKQEFGEDTSNTVFRPSIEIISNENDEEQIEEQIDESVKLTRERKLNRRELRTFRKEKRKKDGEAAEKRNTAQTTDEVIVSWIQEWVYQGLLSPADVLQAIADEEKRRRTNLSVPNAEK
jgi:hypothetical protein